MNTQAPDELAFIDDVGSLLASYSAKQWEDSADALIQAIPRYFGMTPEEALRGMAKVFREVAKGCLEP